MKRYHMTEEVLFGFLLSSIFLLLYFYYVVWLGLTWAWHWVLRML